MSLWKILDHSKSFAKYIKANGINSMERLQVKILHIDSSILGENSCSRRISAHVMARLADAYGDATIVYRDLAANPIPHLSPAYLAAAQGATREHEPELLADLAVSESVLQEFLDADTVVLGVGFYNFSVPSQLKAWVDRIMVAHKTFRYAPDGSIEGLAGGKRVILCVARGGFYSPGTPGASVEHCETLLRGIFNFVGVTQVDTIEAEGLAVGPEHRAKGMAMAEEAIARLPA